MIPNRNFAASAILACTASQIHWEMGKEVVNYWTALDAGVTPAINTEKHGHKSQSKSFTYFHYKNRSTYTLFWSNLNTQKH